MKVRISKKFMRTSFASHLLINGERKCGSKQASHHTVKDSEKLSEVTCSLCKPLVKKERVIKHGIQNR